MLNNQDFAYKRRNCLGGSDIGPILGLSPYRSALDVWLEKTGRRQDDADKLVLRFGYYAEEFIAREYALATHSCVSIPESVYIHPDHAYLCGHLDRLVQCQDGTIKILECKTANPFRQSDWGLLGSDEVPITYLTQCQWYLMLTGFEALDLAVLFGNSDFRIYQIFRDPQLGELLLERALHFWHTYVLKDQAPPPQTLEDHQRLFSHSLANKSIEVDASTLEVLHQIQAHQTQLDIHASQIDQLKSQVMAYMQDAEILRHEAQTLVTWKAPKPSQRLDSKRLQQEQPELYQEYLRPVTNSRRLLIKDLS